MKPVLIHWAICSASALGWLTKKRSTQPRRVATSHRARKTTSRPSRQRRTSACETLLAPLVAKPHLVLEILPDRLVETPEVGMEAHLGHGPRPRQPNRVDGLHPARRRRHHHHAIGERDRLLEVVRDEHDRPSRLRPDL